MKRLLIILFCFFSSAASSQEQVVHIDHSLKGYLNVIKNTVSVFSDSISRSTNYKYFFVEIRVKAFDTLEKRLSLVFNYNVYNTLITFNPTHIEEHGIHLCVFKFDSVVPKSTIRKMPYKVIDKKQIANINEAGKICSDESGYPTGHSASFVFDLSDNTFRLKWYENADLAPSEDKVIDIHSIISHQKYEVWLKKKLKEYGY